MCKKDMNQKQLCIQSQALAKEDQPRKKWGLAAQEWK